MDKTTEVYNKCKNISSVQGQSAAHIPKEFLQHISQDNDLTSESSAINNIGFVSPLSSTAHIFLAGPVEMIAALLHTEIILCLGVAVTQ